MSLSKLVTQSPFQAHHVFQLLSVGGLSMAPLKKQSNQNVDDRSFICHSSWLENQAKNSFKINCSLSDIRPTRLSSVALGSQIGLAWLGVDEQLSESHGASMSAPGVYHILRQTNESPAPFLAGTKTIQTLFEEQNPNESDSESSFMSDMVEQN